MTSSLLLCPSCGGEMDPLIDKEYCPFCNNNLHISFVMPAKQPKCPVNVDLPITIDRTGSSEQFKDGIPLTLESIFQTLVPKVCRCTCWLQTHGDLDYGEECILHTNGGDYLQVLEDIKKIIYNGGGDLEESHLDGIKNLLDTTPWDLNPTQSRRAIIAILTGETKPLKCGMTTKQFGREIRDQGILLYLICEPTPRLLRLVEAAEGMMFEITNRPDPEQLKEIGAELGKTISYSVNRMTERMLTKT